MITRKTILSLLVGALVLGTTIPTRSSAQTYECLSQGATFDLIYNTLGNIVEGIDARHVAAREVAQLPQATVSDLEAVTHNKRCETAGDAFHRVLYPTEPFVDRTLVVIAVGRSHYVVQDITEPRGSLMMVFDKRWNHLATLAS